jgi:outer membrane protein assembly factor BamA
MIGRGIPYVFVEPTMMISTLDNGLQPTKGSFTLITLKGMVPVGGIPLAESFVRLSAEQSFFVPINKVVAAFRLRCGHIFNKKFERIMPVERFFLGGANSIRGYETDFAPPLGRYRDEKCDGRSKEQIVPQGGRSMVNANLELRFPIIGSLGGVLFQDAGALHDSLVAYVHAKDVAAASGFGLRYQTPVGPLRFDAGWRWGSKSVPLRRFVWFLGFGSAF